MRSSTFLVAALAAVAPVMALPQPEPQNASDLLALLSNALNQPASTPAAAPAATTPAAVPSVVATEAPAAPEATGAGEELGQNVSGLLDWITSGGGLSSLLSLAPTLLGLLGLGGGGGDSTDTSTTGGGDSSTGGLNLDFLSGLFGGGANSTAGTGTTPTSEFTLPSVTSISTAFTGAAALPTGHIGAAGAAIALAAMVIA